MHVFGAVFNDFLHVAALGTDEASGDLEFFVVGNLDVEPARILYCLVIEVCAKIVVSVIAGLGHDEGFRFGRVSTDKYVLVLEHRWFLVKWLLRGLDGLAVKCRVFL